MFGLKIKKLLFIALFAMYAPMHTKVSKKPKLRSLKDRFLNARAPWWIAIAGCIPLFGAEHIWKKIGINLAKDDTSEGIRGACYGVIFPHKFAEGDHTSVKEYFAPLNIASDIVGFTISMAILPQIANLLKIREKKGWIQSTSIGVLGVASFLIHFFVRNAAKKLALKLQKQKRTSQNKLV